VEAVANGELVRKWTQSGLTHWVWNAEEPMASYLATATMGQFDLTSYRHNGIRFWDAIDRRSSACPKPRTGQQYAISQRGDPSYKRLMRKILRPTGWCDSFVLDFPRYRAELGLRLRRGEDRWGERLDNAA
jgi:hypothetical protein